MIFVDLMIRLCWLLGNWWRFDWNSVYLVGNLCYEKYCIRI